ncbi:sensor domain-containing diguanylate cyclase [Nitrobacter sp.]|uniref:sensor domain-containing diguanylate cyclase n=1 Tax=Nitrobacter sp. TaxID=29420 RepID=UPI00399D707B
MIYRLPIEDLRQIFLSLPVPVCLLDRETHYLGANHRYADICNTSLDVLAGKSMQDFCPPELVANARRDFQVLDTGGIIPAHEIIYRNTTFLVSVSPLSHGRDKTVSAIAVTLTDISKLKLEFAAVNENLAVAYKQMQEHAETDALTGLANRHGLRQFFERELRRCTQEQRPISVAIIDVDYFKSYNDHYGHVAGDEGLKAIASAIRSSIRSRDYATRYGGEELVVILPDTDLAGAEHVAETILHAVRSLSIQHKGSPFERITVSIGVVGVKTVPRGLYSADVRDSLLRSADKALYAAKDAGRNCVKVWNDKF